MGEELGLEGNEGGHCMSSTAKEKEMYLKKGICRAKRKMRKFPLVIFFSVKNEKWEDGKRGDLRRG